MSRRGMSLVETLVGAGVACLVTAILYALLVGGMRLYHHGSNRSELQLAATLALGRLVCDLEASGPRGLSLAEHGIGLVPLQGVSADSRSLWKEEVVLYYQDGPRLLRKLCPPLPEEMTLALDPTSPVQLSPEDLVRMFGGGGAEPTVLARDVTAFETSRPAGNLVSLHLALQRPNPGGTVACFDLRREVYLRNP